MDYNEANTIRRLILPKLRKRGWTNDLLREQIAFTAASVPQPQTRRADILLQLRLDTNSQPLLIAVIETKREYQEIDFGLQQSIEYANVLNVPFAFATDGHSFIMFDRYTNTISPPQQLDQFPTPAELRSRYEQNTKLSLGSPETKPLRAPYPGGDTAPYPHQDAAIRSVLEAVLQGKQRILVELAPGLGKSFIIANILKRLIDSGKVARALLITDRVGLAQQFGERYRELMDTQLITSFAEFNSVVARLFIVTFQKLKTILSSQTSLLQTFDIIILDDFDGYAGGWSRLLLDKSSPIQIAFTSKQKPEIMQYFGSEVYSYSIDQAKEYGYLQAQKPSELLPRIQYPDDNLFPTTNPSDVVTGKPIPDTDIFRAYLIFISYRWDDSKPIAEKLYKRLSEVFNFDTVSQVFMDTSSTHYGENFIDRIYEAIDKCEIVLALIGRLWLTIPDSTGKRRLDNPDDTLRKEIEYALANKKLVLPVLVNRANIPSESALPDSPLRQLSRIQSFEIVHKDKYFDSEVDELIEALQLLLKQRARLDD